MVIRAVLGDELGVRAMLDNFTVRKHKNHISFLNCAQTVRYSNNRLLFLLEQPIENARLRQRINRTRRFV